MPRRVLIAASLVMLAAMPAMAQPKAAPKSGGSDDPVIAKINGQVLHKSDLELALAGAPPQIQQQPFDKIYPQLLNSMVNAELLAQAGRKAKVDQNPIIRERLNAVETQIIAYAYVDTLARAQITDAKVKEAYDQYAKQAPQNEEVHARHILVGSEQEAKDIIDQLKKGADFATLAKDKTTDPSGKSNGGDLGYFTKQDMVPEFATAAFALKPGEFTQTPVHTQFGWHVIKVEDKRKKPAPSFDEVKPQIEQYVTRKAQADLVTKLRADAKIEKMYTVAPPAATAAPADKK
jgi:peptidyl-prolyl cis-trans isomerase C